MFRVLKRSLTSVVPKGFKKYVKEISLDPISPNKLLIDEISHISSRGEFNLTKNSVSDISTFWFQNKAPYKEVEADVIALSKISGHGICFSKELQKFIIVPFTLPGDKILVILKRHYEYYIEGKLVKFLNETDKEVPRCQYFGQCSGCQLQKMTYKDQMSYKKDIVRFAFQNLFQSNEFDTVIQETVASPLQYGYRTKLTPHFDRLTNKNPELKIGLNNIDNKIMDIENCEIATNIVNQGLRKERERVQQMIPTGGGTLAVRESFDNGSIIFKNGAKDLITEKVDGKLFQFPIYTFFQNNNSILPVLLKYMQSHISPRFTKLIDTYCGSGFFSISLSHLFEESIGIEISSKSIEYAKSNSDLNHLQNVEFISGTASNIFSELQKLDPSKSCVLMDPSRKGSSSEFLKQLADFKPGLIIYVSCNVYSQSRDLYEFLKTLEMEKIYKIKEIRGFDFFPQTKHVESVAILEKRLYI